MNNSICREVKVLVFRGVCYVWNGSFYCHVRFSFVALVSVHFTAAVKVSEMVSACNTD